MRTRKTILARHEGEARTYLSGRSVRGYPYLAEAEVVARRRRDGRLVWWPTGTRSTLSHWGVPGSWYRDGTERAREAARQLQGAPRPWDYADEGES